MKLSTVSIIYWVAMATFWVLFIINVINPDPTPKLQGIAMDLCVYVFLSAQFYIMGVKRGIRVTGTPQKPRNLADFW